MQPTIHGCILGWYFVCKLEPEAVPIMASTRCSSPDDDGYKRFTDDVQICYGSNDNSKYKRTCNHHATYLIATLFSLDLY